jgi:pimeloyl-ACP methyl ester carboxylesterase
VAKVARVVFFSGMGGDSRMFQRIRVPGFPMETPEHLEPLAGETLPAFAARTAESRGLGEDDVVAGMSFGGMLAAQISVQRKIRGAILLGSCHQTRRLPAAYRAVEFSGRFTPDFLLALRSWRPFVAGRFAPIGPADAAIMAEMAAGYPTSMLRRFGRMIVEWSGVEAIPCPKLAVHGDKDVILPPSCVDADVIVPDAGHAFTLTHPNPINAAMLEFVNRLAAGK